MERLQVSYEKTIEDIKNDWSRKEHEMKKDHQNEITLLTKDHQSQEKEMKQEWNYRLSALQKEIETSQNLLQIAKEDNQRLNGENEQLKTTLGQREKEIDTLTNENLQQINEFKSQIQRLSTVVQECEDTELTQNNKIE